MHLTDKNAPYQISDKKDEPKFAAAPAIDEGTLAPPDDHLWRDSHYPSEAKSKARSVFAIMCAVISLTNL